VVGEREDGSLVTVADLRVTGAVVALLKDAIHPNLVQTLEGTPALVHGGPFGNIAHGCSSLVATKLALKCAEVVVTEAGFGTDLGAEKFVHIKCRAGHLRPSVAVVVASLRALRVHGRTDRRPGEPDPAAVERGLANLDKHVENVRRLGMQPVVALNLFPGDSAEETELVLAHGAALAVPTVRFRAWEQGGEGALELAEVVDGLARSTEPPGPRYLYDLEWPTARKLDAVATALYGASGVDLSSRARAKLARYEELGYRQLPVCVAKTQYSLSDDPEQVGRPQGFRVAFRDVRLAAGAGFVVAYAGDVLTMPGLPKHPAAQRWDLDSHGRVVGLT
jgi:formate--tetrahydrofolate ligase